jgi:hypothetical protein
MTNLIVRLDPRLLDNPDANIRYVLPELLAERSGGLICDAGHDYVGESAGHISRGISDGDTALACILDVVENGHVLDNHLGVTGIPRLRNYKLQCRR